MSIVLARNQNYLDFLNHLDYPILFIIYLHIYLIIIKGFLL
jgi:hypothetical protein